MDTKRITIDVLRHAKPLVGEDKRSKDVLSEQGIRDSVDYGASNYAGAESLYVFSSPLSRAIQTGTGIIVGSKKEGIIAVPEKNLGLEYMKDSVMPKGIPYGPEWISQFVSYNPGIVGAAAEEIFKFIHFKFDTMPAQNPVIVGISHGPKVELAYGRMMGMIDAELSDLAASPLEGFSIDIDLNSKSGVLGNVQVAYKGDAPRRLATKSFIENVLAGNL